MKIASLTVLLQPINYIMITQKFIQAELLVMQEVTEVFTEAVHLVIIQS